MYSLSVIPQSSEPRPELRFPSLSNTFMLPSLSSTSTLPLSLPFCTGYFSPALGNTVMVMNDLRVDFPASLGP